MPFCKLRKISHSFFIHILQCQRVIQCTIHKEFIIIVNTAILYRTILSTDSQNTLYIYICNWYWKVTIDRLVYRYDLSVSNYGIIKTFRNKSPGFLSCKQA